jgi:predicted RNA-binding Zn ribbon-like protein
MEELPIDSTRLCCNFVNTIYSWKQEDDYDFLQDYNIFIDWCVKLNVADDKFLDSLRRHAKRNTREANKVMNVIRNRRLLVHDLISAIAGKDQKEIKKMLALANPVMKEALNHMHLDFDGHAFVVSHQSEKIDLKAPLWIILKSLYDLITEMEIVRIKECPTCGWVFYDETKNGKRKWCNPLNCGTQDKMNRYNQKLRNQEN